MRVIADLHIHSRFSRATSQTMNLIEIERFAQVKGLSVVGCGDFTHPLWIREIKKILEPIGDAGLYKISSNEPKVAFMISGEVCTIFESMGKIKKIHHIILSPSIEVAEQISDRLVKFGDLTVDGRPILKMTAAELVEEVLETSIENMIFPAHAWTPWFSIFGANSGFDSVEECYGDKADKIHAIETGLSSDPKMNWRVSKLDRYTLVSNSDSHSAWPWRMGREANVFDLQRLNYREIIDAIRSRDSERFKFTIETDPAYGKYHWTGHRECGISMPPSQAILHNNICPKCKRPMAKGVEQRVEELADRPPDYRPAGVPDYVYLLPLSEIIASVIGVDQPSNPKVWNIYNDLVSRFGDEYTILLDVSKETLIEAAGHEISDAILAVRSNRVRVIPGYDGVYGRIEFQTQMDNRNFGKGASEKKIGLDQFI
ncbi:MAG: endonuclease Q family protein [Candidatus Bathyarchaeia archaeon]